MQRICFISLISIRYYLIQMITDPFSSNRKAIDHLCAPKDSYTIQISFTQTPKSKQQTQIIQSPFVLSTRKDLFSELLGTDRKDEKDLMLLGMSGAKEFSTYSDIDIEEFQNEPITYEYNGGQQNLQSQKDDKISEKSVERSIVLENDLSKRRKRKTNQQLKILKFQFENRNEEWTKNQIIKMSQITGLSEGQVYKWCWDQKKKINTVDKMNKCLKNPVFNDENQCPNIMKTVIKKQSQTRISKKIFSRQKLKSSKRVSDA